MSDDDYEENEDEYGLEDAEEDAEEYGEGFNYGDLGRVHFTHDLLARNLMYNNIGELKNKILKMNLTPQENFAIILNAHFQDDRYKYNLTEEDLKFMLDKVVENVILQDEVKFINPFAYLLGYICIKNREIDVEKTKEIIKENTDNISPADIIRYVRLWKNII